MSYSRCDLSHDSHGTIRVVLKGGPAELPSEMLLEHGVLADRKIKVPHYGGYEHFELVDDGWSEPGGMPVFRWTTRTKVAE